MNSPGWKGESASTTISVEYPLAPDTTSEWVKPASKIGIPGLGDRDELALDERAARSISVSVHRRIPAARRVPRWRPGSSRTEHGLTRNFDNG